MIPALSPNSQAILLLTAPLVAGRGAPSAELLSLGEYNRLAKWLREKKHQPADLIGPGAADLVNECAALFEASRLEKLLARGFLLSQAVDRWHSRAIWVISRADPEFPRRLKAKLKEDAPPLLYGCGDLGLLEAGGLAVVGSRDVSDELLTYTANAGALAARSARNLVSGAARGVDQAAMRGALHAGGTVVGVMADSLERAALAREHREFLMDERLTLVSPYDPAAGFNVGHAMQRNKCIYALADAALVVNSDFNKGGTWTGAVEQLEKYHCGPLFVRVGDNVGKGNLALVRKGALPWPEPKNADAFADALATPAAPGVQEQQQESLPLGVEEARSSEPEMTVAPPERSATAAPAPETELDRAAAKVLHTTVAALFSQLLTSPATEDELAKRMDVVKPQVKAWLARFIAEGRIKKLNKPVRYRWVSQTPLA